MENTVVEKKPTQSIKLGGSYKLPKGKTLLHTKLRTTTSFRNQTVILIVLTSKSLRTSMLAIECWHNKSIALARCLSKSQGTKNWEQKVVWNRSGYVSNIFPISATLISDIYMKIKKNKRKLSLAFIQWIAILWKCLIRNPKCFMHSKKTKCQSFLHNFRIIT